MIKKGFSLAEMMIVMLILSIVLAAATPIITRRVIAGEQAKDVSAIPAGIVNSFAGIQIPDGWLLCNGQAVSRGGNYADLYNAIGTTFGSGDGASTFNLPDLRGEFIRGWDNGRGVDSARGFGSLQNDMIKSHIHEIANYAGGMHFDYSPGGDTYSRFYPNFQNGYGTNLIYAQATGGIETRPRNIALNYIIKY